MDDDEAEDDPVGVPEPTSALPGTAEKIEVLRLRVVFGVQLWHPEDNLGVSDAWFEDKDSW